MNSDNLATTDYLAIERTNLANERTLLAYSRTFLILVSSGFAIVRLDFLKEINLLGIILLLISPLVLTLGIIRFLSVRRRIAKNFINTKLDGYQDIS